MWGDSFYGPLGQGKWNWYVCKWVDLDFPINSGGALTLLWSLSKLPNWFGKDPGKDGGNPGVHRSATMLWFSGGKTHSLVASKLANHSWHQRVFQTCIFSLTWTHMPRKLSQIISFGARDLWDGGEIRSTGFFGDTENILALREPPDPSFQGPYFRAIFHSASDRAVDVGQVLVVWTAAKPHKQTRSRDRLSQCYCCFSKVTYLLHFCS